jgi:hypothetical protein
MKRLSYILIIAAAACIVYACSKSFLDRDPVGALDDEVLSNKKGVEALLIGAYSLLDGYQAEPFIGDAYKSAGSNWVYGAIAGGDAHKGSDPTDQPSITPIEQHNPDPNNDYFNVKWKVVYEGVNRANNVLVVMSKATDIEPADVKRITAEARFLRAHYHLDARKIWGKVPYLDETTTEFTVPNPKVNIPNDKDILPMIEADFKFAYDNLPETLPEIGRANKWAAGAMLGKTLLFEKKYAEARTVLTDVVNNGKTTKGEKYDLLPNFQDNFNAAFKNSRESVFAVQYSVNDGSGGNNGSIGEDLNYPNGGIAGCCGFFQPSQDLVNSFTTDAVTGLPNPDIYNTTEVTNDLALNSGQPFTPYNGPLDPRLDWTVGRRGVPYLDWGPHPGAAWVRNKEGGPYAPKKNVYYRAQRDIYVDNSFWGPIVSANNYAIMRFSDVLLMLAEAEVDAPGGSLETARALVNRVRTRAANPGGTVGTGLNAVFAKASVNSQAAMLALPGVANGEWVIRTDLNSTFVLIGSPSSSLSSWNEYKLPNYKISNYTAPWTDKNAARKLVHFERKLELAMEGHRFFDLVRWGEAAATLNAYFQYEKKISPYLNGVTYQANVDDYFPIPQRQIVLSGNVLKQNEGY